MMFYQNKQAGFSLVETLVAISILLIVVVGPMTISMRTAKSTSFASEQIQAFFLAQEGLELAQKTRDDLLLRSFLTDGNAITDAWASFTNTNSNGVYRHCYAGTGCGLEWGSTVGALATPVPCSTVTNCLLRRDDTGRAWFTHAAGSAPTQFTRRIFYTAVGDRVAVRSVVTWRTGSLVAEQSVVADTYLYNIYGNP
jgi:prepilin-type N-terminal cleavage/methylation domain-containing protein